ncbi:MAG: SDR family oxidoreductase [Gemmatimonadota bacterium]|nr:MAG: SDR family oxidoreductase [Gemmatimonadota bacterium]
MKVAIIGASGQTGLKLVRESLRRGHQVVAVCRTSSADRLKEFSDNGGCTVITAPVVSDLATLTQALAGCDAGVAVLISVRRLRATELVRSLAKAAAANGVKRLVFTAGEVTAAPEKDETFTLRQRIMLLVFTLMTWFTPYSMTDMIEASVLVRQQPDWDWTIVRAPTLREEPGVGYRLCEINEVTAKHVLSREDYATCLLDSLENPEHYRRALTVVSAGG